MKTTKPDRPRRAALGRLAQGALAAALPAVGAGALLGAGRALRAQPPEPAAPLVLVLAPFLTPRALLQAFEPLRSHLERALGQPVLSRTARDFQSLAAATRRAEHDLVQLPAHLARLAMLDWGWQALVGPDLAISAVVAVRDTGPVREPASLRGRRIAMLDPLSLTATVGRAWLLRQGLAGAVELDVQPSVNSMLYALDRGQVDAFVCADTQLATLPASTPRGERVLARIEDIPGPLILARPGMPGARVQALRRALRSFEPDRSRPPSAANVALRGFSDDELARLDVYAAEARRALGETGAPKR